MTFSYPSAERHSELIAKYCISDMGDNSTVGSELSSILERLDVDRALSHKDKQYIRDKGLFDLCAFIEKLEYTGKPDFRILRARIEQQQKRTWRRELWEKYGIDYIDGPHMRQMINILLRVEKGARMQSEDVLWLITNKYFFPELKCAFHRNEAMFFRQSFESSKDPWHAVNASSHFRKARLPSEAADLLEQVDIEGQKNKRLKSALCTTKGGSKRDLRKFDEALRLAESAHLYDPRSFHPCTLLGALNYELGNLVLGAEWFEKAVSRGAKLKDVDHELRSIFECASGAQKDELKRHLLEIDPVRYSWVKKTTAGKRSNRSAVHYSASSGSRTTRSN
jgi:hypothetical protein